MPEWKAIGISVGTGAVAGVADQLIQNMDEKKKREDVAAGRASSIWKQIGTYYNYGLPIVIIAAAAAGALKGAWLERMLPIAGQLAGRKVTAQVSKVQQAAPWRPYSPAPRSPAPQSAAPVERSYQQGFESAIAI